MNKTLKISLGIVISLLCLWIALREVPFIEFTSILVGAQYLWLLPVFILTVIGTMARGVRWTVLLKTPEKRLISFWAISLGNFVTYIFPLRLGEVAKVVAMAERCKLPVVQVAGATVVERLLDVGSVVLMLVFALPWMKIPDTIVRAGQSFGALVLAGFLAIVLLARFRQFSIRLARGLVNRLRFLPATALLARWEELLDGLTLLTHSGVAIQAILWSSLAWFCSVLTFWFVLIMFQTDGMLYEAAFITSSISLAMTVPSSPGYIGVFQLVGQQALVIPFGDKYNMSNALAITLTAHVAGYIINTILGVLSLWQLGESFSGLSRRLFGEKNS